MILMCLLCACLQFTTATGTVSEVTTAYTTVRHPAESALHLYREWTWPHCHLVNGPGTTAPVPETWTPLERDLMTEEQVRIPFYS